MRKGFTLVETILYTALVALVSVTLVRFSFVATQSRAKVEGSQEALHNLRRAMEEVSETIREAQSIDRVQTVTSTDPGRLVLVFASSTRNPTIIGVDQNQQLYIKSGSSATTTVTNSNVYVSSLTFVLTPTTETDENVYIDFTVIDKSDSTNSAGRAHTRTSVTLR